MTLSTTAERLSDAHPPPPPSDLRQVRRAVVDMRAGFPVRVEGNRPILLMAAETACADGLADFAASTLSEPLILLARSRAEALFGPDLPEGAAIALAARNSWRNPAWLHAVADPTQGGDALGATLAPVPEEAEAALLLAKLGRLLPVVLLAPSRPLGKETSVSADAILDYPDASARSLVRVAEARVPLAEAPDARLVAFRPEDGGLEHVALLIGRPEEADAPLTRIHSECFTGDLLGSMRCDCGPQLHQAISRMQAEGAGVLLYMAQEGRGIGLVSKLRAYALQDSGLDTLDANRALGWGADERSFVPAAIMLKALGIPRIRLLTNNPEKVASLAAQGIEVAGRVRHAIAANGVNDMYLETKARRFGHLLG